MPTEFISLGEWLIEREHFYNMKSLNFFKKFRKWKSYKMWIRNVRRTKREITSTALENKLFLLHKTFKTVLIEHKQKCLHIENLRFVEVSARYDGLLLEKLQELQHNKRKETAEELEKFSNECRKNVRKGINNILTELRQEIVNQLKSEEEQRKSILTTQADQNTTNTKKRHINATFENLQFPENMLYGQRADLRKECSRFLRFA